MRPETGERRTLNGVLFLLPLAVHVLVTVRTLPGTLGTLPSVVGTLRSVVGTLPSVVGTLGVLPGIMLTLPGEGLAKVLGGRRRFGGLVGGAVYGVVEL